MAPATSPPRQAPPPVAARGQVIGPRTSRSPCCAHHPHAAPTNRCPRCGLLLCDACVTARDVRGVVIDVCACGGVCVPLSAAEAGLEQEPFSRLLAAAFTYPFAGHGRYLVAGGAFATALAVTALEMVLSVGPLFGGMAALLGVILVGYLADYLGDVVVSTTSGGTEPPDWPDFFDPTSSFLGLGRFLVPAAASFGPAYAAARLFGPGAPAFWVLLVLGLLYFPMSMVISAILSSLPAGLSPRRVLRSIARLPRDYFATCGMLALIMVLLPCALVAAGAVPWAGWLLGAFAAFYLLVVAMRVVGLIGLVHQGGLDLS